MTELAWTAAGALGAALYFWNNAWPAAGMRLRNLAAALTALAASAALYLVLDEAWRLGAAWLVAALLLQWSHMMVPPGRFVALRAVAAVALVVGVAAVLAGS
ncbi:MAG: hypothetical protein Q8N31_11385 [Reyranella sp.]|nr:hypothetical protein [Reyranella sp.]MDP3160612.1 hypothetical protein [Reyranella sp.]